MNQAVEQTYRDLMKRLQELPDEIMAAQVDLTATKLELDAAEKAAKEIADTLPTRGNNEGERKANKLIDLQADAVYQMHSQAAAAKRKSIAYQTDAVAAMEREFNSVRYQAKLHAEYMALLANDTTATSIDFGMDASGKSAAQVARVSNGSNGTITAQDAADIGL